MTQYKHEFDTFTWRDIEFRRGLGSFHASSLPHGIKDVAVWFEEGTGFNCWLASIIPNNACAARSGHCGSRGATPQAALDSEVTMWLAAMLALPGAYSLLREAENACFSAAREAAASRST